MSAAMPAETDRSAAIHADAATAGVGPVAGRLGFLPPTLTRFRAAPPIADRTAWRGLADDVRDRLLRRGGEALSAPLPALVASAYLAFTRTGDRAGFEAPYMERRRRLCALVLAECVEAEGRFLDAVVDTVVAIAEESGWQLPAHNSHVRNTPQRPLPDPSDPVIDLFAAETGALLALTVDLLGDALDRAAPGLSGRIDREIDARILTPYLGRHFWWMGRGAERMNNWTAWCTQNVLLAVLSRPRSDAVARAVVGKAAASLDAFLKDYGDDGACEEGVEYYGHAALCLNGALSVLDAVSGGAFAPVWRMPKIRNLAEFRVAMHVAGDRSFNFNDCSPVLAPSDARAYLFGLAVGSPALAAFAAADARRDPEPDLPAEISLHARLLATFTTAAMRAAPAAPPPPSDRWYPSIGLLVAHDGRYALAVKAGSNGEDHNHNDVGSLTLYKDCRPFLIDVGVETYTAKTFSSRRYEIWTMQSAFHNLPTVDGVMQAAGAHHAARDVAVSIGGDAAGIAMDIAGAYPPEARLRHYRRRVQLVKGEGVVVTDEHDGDGRAVLSLMLVDRPEIDVDGLVLPGLGRIRIEGGEAPTVAAIAIDDARLRRAWPERIHRVLVPLGAGRLQLTIV